MFIALRVWVWAVMVRPLKHVVPLPTLVRLVRPWRSVPARRDSLQRSLAGYLSQRGRFPARPPGNCLDRSLATYRLLCSIGAEPRLVVGVRPSEYGVDGHVWIVLDGQPFAERGDVDTFVSVVAFDAQGRREEAANNHPDLTGIRWA